MSGHRGHLIYFLCGHCSNAESLFQLNKQQLFYLFCSQKEPENFHSLYKADGLYNYCPARPHGECILCQMFSAIREDSFLILGMNRSLHYVLEDAEGVVMV